MLQGQHGFESQEECQWALTPPTNVEGFVSGKPDDLGDCESGEQLGCA